MFEDQLQLLWPAMKNSNLGPHIEKLQSATQTVINNINQGDLSRWIKAYEKLPDVEQTKVLTNQAAFTVELLDQDLDEQVIDLALRELHPWRKGPFQVGSCYVDSEWRSDYKWERLLPGLPELKNRTVLDVGCGNGYYLSKMAEYKPKLLLGIEPGLLQNVQYWAVEKYANTGATVLPLKIQDMPVDMRCFDVVFSMGILYHRKSPMAHLEQLKNLMTAGGSLTLETLIVEGDEQTCLVPKGRYAQMRNVWFLPSVEMLCLWLDKIGFKNIHVINTSTTTTAEQRSTEWMKFHSLSDFLSKDQQQTIEGYPPPKRVIIGCQK